VDGGGPPSDVLRDLVKLTRERALALADMAEPLEKMTAITDMDADEVLRIRGELTASINTPGDRRWRSLKESTWSTCFASDP
jgi:hypothetical protein